MGGGGGGGEGSRWGETICQKVLSSIPGMTETKVMVSRFVCFVVAN